MEKGSLGLLELYVVFFRPGYFMYLVFLVYLPYPLMPSCILHAAAQSDDHLADRLNKLVHKI